MQTVSHAQDDARRMMRAQLSPIERLIRALNGVVARRELDARDYPRDSRGEWICLEDAKTCKQAIEVLKGRLPESSVRGDQA